jgi:hypothetical protein
VELRIRKTSTVSFKLEKSLLTYFSFADETRFEDQEAELRKIDNEIRMLKRRATATPTEGAGGDVSAD